MAFAKRQIEKILDKAGIKINGPNDWDIRVLNEKLYWRVIKEGSLGLGEAYMEGWWEVKKLDEFFYRILKADIDKEPMVSWQAPLHFLRNIFFNLQSVSRAFMVGEKHYDIGNDVYEAMLDGYLVYSCGYWKKAKNLDQAQIAKLDLICQKIGLEQGDRLLDIGSGWGGLLKYAAEKYGVKGVGVTVSKEQAKLAKERTKELPVTFSLQDYRTMEGKFDHIVSVGMFEHVGYKNYRTYMQKAHDLLEDNGLFLLHTIGTNNSSVGGDAWIEKYIFPNGQLPSVAQIGKSIEGLFVMEDWHNFGADYDKTLMAWFKNFDNAWPKLKDHYSEHFYRMWKYYLLSCAGGFRARSIQLWQVVLSKKGVVGGYQSKR